MDWKRLDGARSSVGPIELDLIESYAQGKVSRRDFVKRGTIIGLSVPVMGGIIAACGGSDDASPTTDAPSGSDPATSEAPSSGATGGNIVFANQQGDANSGLNPIDMLDLGTYNVLSQSMEFLVGLGDDGNIAATALATDWAPNDDGSEWTFNLRPGVKWQDGSDFTSADVAATMDRLVAKANAGLDGVIGEGSVDSSDPLVAKFTLIAPNGNFPVLVSIFNSQSLIAPADYTDGTTLDERPAGTGAWVLDSFDVATFTAKYSRNENWWGGKTPLDTIELRGFADIGTAVTAMSSREVDGLQQFSVIGGEGLLNDDNFVVLAPPASNHRQLWFNTQQGQFADQKLIRQAFAWCWDREQMVSTLFNGRADIGNDHPILASLPFYDPDAVEQRSRNIEKAKALLAEAGVDSVTANIESGDLQEIPQLAEIMKQNAAEAGIELTVNVQSNSTFYGDSWCPGASATDDSLPCDGSSEFGIVDYGHRPIPDIFLGSALATGGVWNSSNWANSDFDTELANYRSAVDVEGQKTAISKIQKLVWDEVPASYPYFYNYLAGHDKSVSNVKITALGQAILSAATKEA